MSQETSPRSARARLGYIWDTPLKAGERHIRRQVLGSRRFAPVVLARRTVGGAHRFPAPVRVLTERRRAWTRAYRRYVLRQDACVHNQIPETLQALVAELRLRLVHVFFGTKAVFYLPALESIEIPVSVSFHGADVSQCEHDPSYRGALGALFARADTVMARSGHMASELTRLGCDEGKLWINRAGIPLDEFESVDRVRSAGHPFTVIQICRLIPKKGLRDTLEAFQRLRVELPEARLCIVGDGEQREALAAEVEERGLGAAVTLTGFVDPSELRRLLAEADLFVHPSVTTPQGDHEGIPNSLLEAMATGLAPIATRHAGIPEAVAHGERGWLVDERAPDQIAERMLWCARNPQALREAGTCAREFVQREHGLPERMKRLDEKYAELISAHDPA